MRDRRVERELVGPVGAGRQMAERPVRSDVRLTDMDPAHEVRLVGESPRCRHRGKQDGQDA
jgi:hypothetical protein